MLKILIICYTVLFSETPGICICNSKAIMLHMDPIMLKSLIYQMKTTYQVSDTLFNSLITQLT